MNTRSQQGSISFGHAWAFWLGTCFCTVGGLLHLPMYIEARSMGYRMAGMRPDAAMLVGMTLIVLGLAATVFGLLPRAREPVRRHDVVPRMRALDEARITGTHVGLLVVMAIAVTLDVMKPTTLSFIAVGVAREYGLRAPGYPGRIPEALLPLAGITGTVVGAFVWGWLGDRIGRRASILLAGILFATTAICGTMPTFDWNLFMCFMMGVGVGGMLPITFALIAETIPARHRGWLMVLIGGDVAGAYVLTSWLAETLMPHYSWRIMWLVGLPTGLILIGLNHWIPESPRFLLENGRGEEARLIMARYGIRAVTDETDEVRRAPAPVRPRLGYARLARKPYAGFTAAMILLGLAIGLMTYGFQLWIPANLQRLGMSQVSADRVLRDSALIGLPMNFVAAWLYGYWRSKATVVLLGILTATALSGFVLLGDQVAHHPVALYALLAVPLWGISSAAAVLVAYSAEVYPTIIRAHGSGLASAVSKAGGVLIIALVAASFASPSITVTAAFGAIPMVLAVAAVLAFGPETRNRRLEDITLSHSGAQQAIAS